MENSWQGKCSIPWPSSSPSPQFQSQGSRSQIDMTASHYMHPFVAHENGSIERAIRQEPTLLSSPNLGSVKSGKPELGNSFLALLSGPSNQLHFDYQQLLNSRSVSATNLPIHDSGIVVTGPSPGVSCPLTGNESMGNRAELSPFVVSRQQSTSTCNRVALSHDNLQMAGMNFHGSDSTKQSLLNTVQSNETGMDISFLRRGWLNNTIPLNTRQQHTINFDASPKISQEAKFSVSDLASSSIRGHPRVFCLNTSGDLLLSDVGRLGVICLCHNLHMSVANFCEHSGSCAVNPGDVVRLESGETIGQWRKLHFTKFGLRVPDDNTGWDWADGSSQLSESAKHKVTMQCISKNSGIFQPLDPSGGKTRFDQQWNDLVSPNNPYKGHPVLENPGKKVIQNARQRNSLEGCNALLKNFVGTTHGILPTMADNQTIQASKIAFDNERKNYGYQSNVQYIDSINRGENSFFSNQNFGNIISLDKGADVSRCDGSRETFIMDRDTIHSNIELRLGQPSQQSHTIVGPIRSSVRPQGISTLSDPHNTQFYGQLIQRAVNPRVTEESRRNLRCAPPDSLVTKHREKESQLNAMSHALRSLNAAENASLDQLKGLPPTGHFSISEGTVLQAAENNLNNCEHFMPRIFGGDSHLVKCGLGDFPRNIINGMERKLEMQGLGLSNHFDFGKGSGALADGSSYTPANTVLHRPTNSTMSSSYIPTSLPPATSVCFSATNPLYLSNLKSALQNKKSVDFGQHLLDENLRLLALRRIVEMSKQEHTITEMNRDQGRVHCPLALQMQKKASKETLVTSVLRQGSCAMGSHDASEVAARTLQSCCNHCLGGSFEKLTCRSGSNKSCNFATSTHVMSLYPKESEVRDVHGTDEQPLLRLGRSTNNCTNDFGECVRCSHKEPNPCFIGNCTCALHSNCLTGSCVSRMENLANASKENIASIISKASNMLFSPDVKNNMAPKGKKNLPGRCESVEMHDLMKSGCHSLQWREVPNKVTENCEATCIERPEEVNNAKETIEDQLADTAAKRSNGIIQETESLKEQQMSNICSANSAPAVTEFSVEGTVDTRKMRFMRNLVVDEGSGIEKCYSSDDAPDSGRWTPTLTGNIDLVSTSTLPTQSSHDRNEPKLTKLVRIKKAKNRTAGSCAVREKIHFQQISRDSNTEKKKKVIKWKRLDATLPSSDSSRQYDPPNYNRYSESHFHSCRGVEKPLQIALGKQKSSLKRKRSTPSSNNILSHKPNLHGFDRHKREWGDANETQSSGSDDIVEMPKLLPEMKAKRVFSKDAREQFPKYELNFIDNGKAPKYGSMCCSEHLSEQGVGTRDRHRRPVVCDNYGIITDGKSGVLPKPAKIVSLRLILKNARRCSTTGNAKEEVPIVPSASEKTEACFSKKDGWSDAFSPLKKGRNDEGHVPSKHGISKKCSSAWMKPSMNVSKEVRKRSLYELTRMEANIEKLACISYLEEKEHSQPIEEACSTRISPQNVLFDASNGKKSSPSKFYSKKASKYVQHTGVRSSAGSCLKSAEYSQGHLGETLRVNDKRHVIKGRKRQAFLLDADAFCCVCGSSNKDDFNCLLECNRCLIRVHQACYGVSKVPKGRWCCRPCRSNFENIVCVLCGYEGGAMTQALRSREIVKSLLQEWKIGSESMSSAHPSETLQDGLNLLNTSSRGEASSDAVSITRIRNTDALHRDPVKLNLQNDAISTRNSNNLGDCFQVHNTITAGVLDPGVKQWVHMVCGLWMPGTRCPNVDTMSAFDVSGVSRSRKNVVCSICNRRGGSCIQCRVADCSVLFHPWCAHQKGLLQSEIEGIDNEKVGFYGRCVLHATFSGYCPGDTHLLDGKLEETRENRESTCARTEGYKGRKRDKGFRLNLHGQFSNGGGCLVPQEQINAWLHINGQKSSTRGPVKPPVSDIEYDCRQEYARYKQAKGWKHLVVYKSGIHALGLYTSQYISRGAMVVEYVGEIVGLRVADKREAEYQSGRRVQYKSACYFFRIDKEHIIDATRKGGIARFVNHSCLPNCVAKVISVRNEKKVVFFAERDINPGEEITYDYNFNHEDEGKKIPCFCNSKNCRLYLN